MLEHLCHPRPGPMTAGHRHIFSNVKSTIQIFFLKQTGAGGAGINSAVPGSGEAPSASTFYSRVRTESEAARSLPCSLPPAPGLTATAVDDAAADATPGDGAEAVRVEPSTVLASCGAGLVGPAVFDARSLAAPSLWVISCPGWRGPSQAGGSLCNGAARCDQNGPEHESDRSKRLFIR